MELYSFYQTMTIYARLFTEKEEMIFPMLFSMGRKSLFFVGLIGGGSLLIALFLLQGFGLYKMAKNRGLKNKALAFVPFVSLWYIGKLAGECNFFGQKVKRAGMYAMIAQIVATLLGVLTIVAEMYLCFEYGDPQFAEMGMAYWSNLTGIGFKVSKFYDISGYLFSIFQLVYKIFLVILLTGLYKQYAPKNYLSLALLTLFIPMSRCIIIFVLRGRKAIDYEAYMRARREAYMRQYQQYHNPYGNPYQNPNAYGSGQNGQYRAPKPQDPFEEFSGENKGQNTGGGEKDEDEFFN